jgi:hypothetical protein
VAAADRNSDQVVIRLKVQCQHCGEVAVMELSEEAALRTARVLEAAARGLEPTEVVVTGRDG